MSSGYPSRVPAGHNNTKWGNDPNPRYPGPSYSQPSSGHNYPPVYNNANSSESNWNGGRRVGSVTMPMVVRSTSASVPAYSNQQYAPTAPQAQNRWQMAPYSSSSGPAPSFSHANNSNFPAKSTASILGSQASHSYPNPVPLSNPSSHHYPGLNSFPNPPTNPASANNMKACFNCGHSLVSSSSAVVHPVTKKEAFACSERCKLAILERFLDEIQKSSPATNSVVSVPNHNNAMPAGGPVNPSYPHSNINSGSSVNNSVPFNMSNISQNTMRLNDPLLTSHNMAGNSPVYPSTLNNKLVSHQPPPQSLPPQPLPPNPSHLPIPSFPTTNPFIPSRPSLSSNSSNTAPPVLNFHQTHLSGFAGPRKMPPTTNPTNLNHSSKSHAPNKKEKRDKQSKAVETSSEPINHGSNDAALRPGWIQHGPPKVTTSPLEIQIKAWKSHRAKSPAFWKMKTIVVDTNILVDDPNVIFELHRVAPSLKLIIPYMLVQELDGLKARARGPFANSVRSAISKLHELIVQGREKWIRGQQTTEREPLSKESEGKKLSGDDRILECVNYFHQYSPPGSKAFLLTHDKNLQLKANFAGILTGTVKQVMEYVTTYDFLSKEREMIKALMKAEAARGVVVPQEQLELSDYEGEENEEVDEFKLMKKQSETRAVEEAKKEAKKKWEDEAKAKHEAQMKMIQAAVPEGTKVNLYDISTEEDTTSEEVSSSSDSEDESDSTSSTSSSSSSSSDDESESDSESDSKQEVEKEKKSKKHSKSESKEKAKKHKKKKDGHKDKKSKKSKHKDSSKSSKHKKSKKRKREQAVESSGVDDGKASETTDSSDSEMPAAKKSKKHSN